MPTPVTKVNEYVKDNLESIGGPRDVAAEMEVAYETLRKNYRRQTGLTLGKLIRRSRVREAKRLLRDPDLYCFEICYAVGFSRDDVAARTFKRQTGMTMTEYRRKEGVPGFGGGASLEDGSEVSMPPIIETRPASFAQP